MPLLDIAATAQPCLQNHSFGGLLRPPHHHRYVCFPSKSKSLKRNYIYSETLRPKFLVTAVAATMETKTLLQSLRKLNGSIPAEQPSVSVSSNGDDESEEVDERERLRRLRISKANKGNTPWNKGRKHSAETLRRIRERTKIAMQNPKVKMKLVNLGHAQTEETRKKIGDGVRMGWERRREKLMVQESCYFDWQNLIAEASRRGLAGEEELQWDSYDILNGQLTKEWLESVEQRKNTPRPKGSKRAPKSLEQRKKIAEAIAAKWADPEYRSRVCSGLAKYHGIADGVERKPRKAPSSRQPRTRSPGLKKVVDRRSESEIRIEKLKLRRGKTPLFKDPSASSKLEMIKNIRAQRAAAESKKFEAIERARLLIAEAEKAAQALEVAATKSPIARASLIETRKLIAEAVQSIESIEFSLRSNDESVGSPPPTVSAEITNQVKKEAETANGSSDHIKVNGSQTSSPSPSSNNNFSFGNFSLPDTVSSKEFYPAYSNGFGLQTLHLESLMKQSDSTMQLSQPEENGEIIYESFAQGNGLAAPQNSEESPPPPKPSKKWIRGRLVEVTE